MELKIKEELIKILKEGLRSKDMKVCSDKIKELKKKSDKKEGRDKLILINTKFYDVFVKDEDISKILETKTEGLHFLGGDIYMESLRRIQK